MLLLLFGGYSLMFGLCVTNAVSMLLLVVEICFHCLYLCLCAVVLCFVVDVVCCFSCLCLIVSFVCECCFVGSYC